MGGWAFGASLKNRGAATLSRQRGSEQMAGTGRKPHARLMCGPASAALLLWAGSANAETAAKVEIAPQPLASALNEFGVQTGRQVIFAPSLNGAKTTRGGTTDGDTDPGLGRR